MGPGADPAEYASLTDLRTSESEPTEALRIFRRLDMRLLSRTGPKIATIVLGFKKKLEDLHYPVLRITIKLPKSRQKSRRRERQRDE